MKLLLTPQGNSCLATALGKDSLGKEWSGKDYKLFRSGVLLVGTVLVPWSQVGCLIMEDGKWELSSIVEF